MALCEHMCLIEADEHERQERDRAIGHEFMESPDHVVLYEATVGISDTVSLGYLRTAVEYVREVGECRQDMAGVPWTVTVNIEATTEWELRGMVEELNIRCDGAFELPVERKNVHHVSRLPQA